MKVKSGDKKPGIEIEKCDIGEAEYPVAWGRDDCSDPLIFAVTGHKEDGEAKEGKHSKGMNSNNW